MAAPKKKRVDPVKQREKRVKIAAIVGSVLFLAVAAYEIPSMIAVMNKKAPPGSTYDPGPSSVLPNVAGGATATGAATSGQLVNTDVPPSSGTGQLVSFSVFQTKNPFTPQVTNSSDSTVSSVRSSSTSTGAAAGSSAGVQPATATTPSVMTTTPSTTPNPTSTSTTPGSSVVPPSAAPPTTTPSPTATTTTPVQATVSISVNGTVSHVASQGAFPTSSPVFRLVSWSKGTAQIGIVGGSYATGDPTLTLHVGTPVTLQNQTDDKRYRIELLSTP